MFTYLFLFMVSFGVLLIFSIVACEIVDSLTDLHVEKKENEAAERFENLKSYLEHKEELFYPAPHKKEESFFYGKEA